MKDSGTAVPAMASADSMRDAAGVGKPVRVVVVNGPNLGRLGVRQPDVYGHQDLAELTRLCTAWGRELGLDVEVRQTDDEAEMVRWMHRADGPRGVPDWVR